jgi:Condensation domain/AMP-binding enzyme
MQMSASHSASPPRSDRHTAPGLELPESLPLSFAQQRLWFLEQLEPNTPLYNVPLALRLAGVPRADLLQRALDQVIARHEALRANFRQENGSPRQIVCESASVQIRLVEFEARPGSDPEDALLAALRREAQPPFDLAEDLLVRAALFRVRKTEHVLLLTLHHIVCDEWSLQVLLRELTLLYERYHAGETSPLPELPVQYADYALWQREWLQGPVLAEHLGYWKHQLQGQPARLRLPADCPEAEGNGHQGGREGLVLSREASDGLRELSYGKLNRQANHLAQHLRNLSVGPEVTVGLCVKSALDLAVGMLGIIKAGGAYVPLDPAYPKERLSLMLQDAEFAVLVTQEDLRMALPCTGARVITRASLPGTPVDNPVSCGKPDDLAYVIYTSGSTGRPDHPARHRAPGVQHGLRAALRKRTAWRSWPILVLMPPPSRYGGRWSMGRPSSQ